MHDARPPLRFLLLACLPLLGPVGCTHECESNPASLDPTLETVGIDVAAGGFACSGETYDEPGVVAAQRFYHPGLTATDVELEYRVMLMKRGWRTCEYGDLCFYKDAETLGLRISEMPLRPINGIELADRTFVTVSLHGPGSVPIGATR